MTIDFEKEVLETLSGEKFLILPRIFIKKFGDTVAIYLSALMEWMAFLKKKGDLNSNDSFFMTQEKIKERVFLSEEQQKLSNKRLQELGILTVERGGIRNRNHYKINFEEIYQVLNSPITGFSKSETHPLKINSARVKPTHSISDTVLRSKDSETEERDEASLATGVAMHGSPLLIRRRNKSPIEFIRDEVYEVISYWNSSPDLPHLGVPGNGNGQIETKSFLKAVKDIGEVIDGKFMTEWQSYSKGDIIKAIDGFKTRMTNLDYSPMNKDSLKSYRLTTFFWNPYVSSTQSMFLECLKNPPKLLKNTVPKEEEKNPAMTKWLQKLYADRVLLGQPKTFNQAEINKFIKGANLLSDSIVSLRKRANLITGPYEFCEYVLDSLIKNWGREEIKVGHIGSEWTYTELLPRYLRDLGRID